MSHEIRQLIRDMSLANPLWGAPRIQSGKPRSPDTWQSLGGLHPRAGGRSCAINADGIASMDLFVVPTISFRLLYGLLIMQHAKAEAVRYWR